MKLIIMGPPGSGKGTISEKLIKEFNLFHLAPGEILREEVRKETSLGKEIKKYIQKGSLVPDQFVVEIVKLEVKDKENYILDGFPRSIKQAQEIEDLKIDSVIFLDVPENIIIERLSGRRICEKGEHTYHVKYLPPKKKGVCDHDRTKLIQRKDDNQKVIKERLLVYNQITLPVINYYSDKKILKTIDGSQNPEKVFKEIRKSLNL